MKNATLLILMALVLGSPLISRVAAASDSDESVLLGRYWFPERDGQFEVYKKEDRYFGRVISYHDPTQLDEENANPALRSRLFIGIDMFANFQFDANEGQWTGGTIYDGKNGKTYDCNLWFEASQPNVLQARGYIGFSFLGRTETFDRVIEAP